MPFSNNHNLHVIVRDIEWETDGESIEDLPETVVIPITYEELEDEDALHDGINDYLSDNYGWLVNGYQIGWKKRDEV
jgi:hypothetical protein